jgi:uncharacterized protein (DUF2267 family)
LARRAAVLYAVLVDYDTFVTTVAEAAHLDRDDAERAIRATLQTLADRIAPGEAADLATELPPEAAAWLATGTPAQGWDLDEFLQRVAEREGVDAGTAAEHARAVFLALSRAVSGKEFDDMMAELPREYDRLLPKGRRIEVADLDAFLEKVAERAQLDRDGALHAAEAVLETLAERIAGGEVEDLIQHLPAELQPPLRRRMEATGGEPRRMHLDEFLKRVAEREGVTFDQAAAHARAVLSTLHEAIPDGEFHDLTAQLPHEYDALLATR